MGMQIGIRGAPLLALAMAAACGRGGDGGAGAAAATPAAGLRRAPRIALFHGSRPFTLASALRRPDRPIGSVGLRALAGIAPGSGAGALPLILAQPRREGYLSLPRSLLAARALESGDAPADYAAPSDADADGMAAGAPLVGLAARPAALDDIVIPVVGILGSRLRDSFRSPRIGHVHHAIDIIARRGTPVVAAVDGTVELMKWDHGGGRTVRLLDATRRYILYYAHLSGYAAGLAEGDTVREGRVIGYVGHTGHVIGSSHLHFRIGRVDDPAEWWKDRPLDPYPLLRDAEPADTVH